MFALPYSYYEEGVRRFGFHGLSYEYIASRLPQVDARAAAGRTVVAAPGQRREHVRDCGDRRSIASYPAVHRRRWPADGHALRLPRSGRDSCICWTMARDGRTAPSRSLIYTESGSARSVGDISSDMRTLLASGVTSCGSRRGPLRLSHRQGVWDHLQRHSVAWMRSCLPAASARTRRRFAPASARTPRGSASNSMPARTAAAAPCISSANSRVSACASQPMKS